MTTLVYNSFLEDLARGAIDLDTDTFKALYVTSGYTPDKDAHLKRSAVTNEISGAGYTAGGVTVTTTITKDTANDRLDVSFTFPTLNPLTATGIRQAVIYKARGGAASADELVVCADFGVDHSPSGGPFSVTVTTPLRFQN